MQFGMKNRDSNRHSSIKRHVCCIIEIISVLVILICIYQHLNVSNEFNIHSNALALDKQTVKASTSGQIDRIGNEVLSLAITHEQKEGRSEPEMANPKVVELVESPRDKNSSGTSQVNQRSSSFRAIDSPVQHYENVALNRPVTSDVRGNLGPASVITNDVVSDWLKDRWQAASNMNGDPIPGEHWLEVDLGGNYRVKKFLIDWEKAYSSDYSVYGGLKRYSAGDSFLLASAKLSKTLSISDQHIINEISVQDQKILLHDVRYVTLVIHSPATRWGSSLWRFHIYGQQS